MYAILEAGGKQHRVSAGEKLRIDFSSSHKTGDTLTFDRVLLLGGESPKVGTPLISGAKVTGTVTSQGPDGKGDKGEKLIVYKKLRRHGYEKTIGHRQRYTEVKIDKIES